MLINLFKKVILYLKCLAVFVQLRHFSDIIHDVARKYNEEINVSQLRKLEKLCKKVEKVDLDITF